MTIEAQVQTLIAESPPDLSNSGGMQIVAAVLGQVALNLEHQEYFLLQNLQQQWQITTLQHRSQPELQKTVLYAYGYLADATREGQSADLIAVPIPVVQLLFQVFSVEQVDSLIFVDKPGNREQVRELKRKDLQATVQNALSAHFTSPPTDPSIGIA